MYIWVMAGKGAIYWITCIPKQPLHCKQLWIQLINRLLQKCIICHPVLLHSLATRRGFQSLGKIPRTNFMPGAHAHPSADRGAVTKTKKEQSKCTTDACVSSESSILSQPGSWWRLLPHTGLSHGRTASGSVHFQQAFLLPPCPLQNLRQYTVILE